MNVVLRYHRHRYFPYELRLSLREVQTLLAAVPEVSDVDVRAEVDAYHLSYLRRLTYFCQAVTEEGSALVPDQAQWEASTNGGGCRRGQCTLKRQSTRYSLHSLHEYKGRFNPQVVRAIGNVLKIDEGASVLDPFCGSGTSLLEAAHIGWNAVGLDLNPLAVMIANAKLALLALGLEGFTALASRVLTTTDYLVKSSGTLAAAFSTSERKQLEAVAAEYELPGLAYLEHWFSPDVLLQFRALLMLIESVPDERAKLGLKVCLSDIVRDVSYQEPADLRIRRRKVQAENYPALIKFAERTQDLVMALTNTARVQHLVPPGTRQIALYGDSRLTDSLLMASQRLPATGKPLFDAAITSPPYANALPYIDTQRLSLVLLGLLPSADLVSADRALIGSREISERQRSQLEEELRENQSNLPETVHGFLAGLLTSVESNDVGFRRKHRPALLYEYFSDMKRVFMSVANVLKTDAPFALIVGTNTFSIDGGRIEIPTPQYLGSIAETCGYAVEESEALDTYPRYDLHQANSINAETLLILRKL